MKKMKKMKKKIPFKKWFLSFLTAVMVFGITDYFPVYASQVTIVVPGTTEPPESTDTPKLIQQEVFPVSVIESYDEQGRSTVIRRYELSRVERPENIPREDFVFGNKTYTLTDIIRATNQNVEIKEVTETVEKSSSTNNLEQVLALLEEEIVYDDGQFIGTLSLDVGSIKVEEAGRKTSSRTATITREYPNLSSRDSSLVPKTVSQSNVNYTLTGVNWVAGNTSTVDYTSIGDYYTANATYSASLSSTKVTGYKVTANYSGEVGFTNSDIIVYEAVFMELRHPAQIVTKVPPSATSEPPDKSMTDLQNNPVNVEASASTDNQEIQESPPIIREVSREELLKILDGEASEAQGETAEPQAFQFKLWWILPVLLLGGAVFFFRKRRKSVF